MYLVLATFANVLLADRDEANDPKFRIFRRQLFHDSLRFILHSLKRHMQKPELVYCGDGFYRWIIYALGPYIADYPEQTLVSCCAQGWCPKYVSI